MQPTNLQFSAEVPKEYQHPNSQLYDPDSREKNLGIRMGSFFLFRDHFTNNLGKRRLPCLFPRQIQITDFHNTRNLGNYQPIIWSNFDKYSWETMESFSRCKEHRIVRSSTNTNDRKITTFPKKAWYVVDEYCINYQISSSYSPSNRFHDLTCPHQQQKSKTETNKAQAIRQETFTAA